MWLQSCRKPTSAVSYIRDNFWFSRNIKPLSDCRMSQFIYHVWKKPLLFILILEGYGDRSFSLQINITKDITWTSQWVKDFSMISYLVYHYCLLYFDCFTILAITVYTQPAIAWSGLAMFTHTGCGTRPRLAIKTPERSHYRHAFIVNFGHDLCLVLKFLLLTLGK